MPSQAEDLPEIEVLEVVTSGSASYVPTTPARTIDSAAAFAPLIESIAKLTAMLRFRSMRAATTPNPRSHSRVTRRVAVETSTLRDLLSSPDYPGPPGGGSDLRIRGDRFTFDPRSGCHRQRGTLAVPWSALRVPIWLTISTWRAGEALIGIELRGARRPHYSIRYFDAAHAVLDQLVAGIACAESTIPRSFVLVGSAAGGTH